MRAEVTFLGGVIFRINEDGIVGASSHAGLATNADRFVKIDDAVSALEHCRSRTGDDTRRVGALIAPGHLVCTPRLRKHSDIYMFDVGSSHADGHDVFRFAGGRARVTADATRVVDDLCPLNALVATWLLIDHLSEAKAWRAL